MAFSRPGRQSHQEQQQYQDPMLDLTSTHSVSSLVCFPMHIPHSLKHKSLHQLNSYLPFRQNSRDPRQHLLVCFAEGDSTCNVSAKPQGWVLHEGDGNNKRVSWEWQSYPNGHKHYRRHNAGAFHFILSQLKLPLPVFQFAVNWMCPFPHTRIGMTSPRQREIHGKNSTRLSMRLKLLLLML